MPPASAVSPLGDSPRRPISGSRTATNPVAWFTATNPVPSRRITLRLVPPVQQSRRTVEYSSVPTLYSAALIPRAHLRCSCCGASYRVSPPAPERRSAHVYLLPHTGFQTHLCSCGDLIPSTPSGPTPSDGSRAGSCDGDQPVDIAFRRRFRRRMTSWACAICASLGRWPRSRHRTICSPFTRKA